MHFLLSVKPFCHRKNLYFIIFTIKLMQTTHILRHHFPGSSLDTSFKLLHESEEKLRVIVNNKFDSSVHTRDVASIERFFKIFPLIGLHEEGLTKFGKYQAAKVGGGEFRHEFINCMLYRRVINLPCYFRWFQCMIWSIKNKKFICMINSTFFILVYQQD